MNTSTSPLPDLFPYLVPKGASIPDGTRYALTADVSGTLVFTAPHCVDIWIDRELWTEVPIPEPRPAPPNPYDRLENVITTNGNHWDCAFWALDSERNTDTLPWLCANVSNGATEWVSPNELASWTVVDVTSRLAPAADPMDETNHRRRIATCKLDGDKSPLHWSEVDGKWHTGHCPSGCQIGSPSYLGQSQITSHSPTMMARSDQ